MAILEMTNTEVVQRCANCDSELRIPLASLQVGFVNSPIPQGDSRVIPLPQCPTCRSSEVLLRSPDEEPEHPSPGSFGHLHRLMVDHLHSELVKADRVIPALKDQAGRADPRIAKPVPQAERAKWFPRGLKLEPPGREEQ